MSTSESMGHRHEYELEHERQLECEHEREHLHRPHMTSTEAHMEVISWMRWCI
ncbi:hypothetical protein [Limnohabitans sp.]|uniref:hypothetical protein n=1 Tax=Limnohabitans sp. TaxID=1907725 RepID=UPI0033400BA1